MSASASLDRNAMKRCADAIRVLSMDAVQAAKSGHPGMPMGMADIAQVLWCNYLRHNPADPAWFDRDRFVLSNGHGSMLLYALLHLSGYDLPMTEIERFRQLHSKTPGHPERGITPGVETTTGPLGQGLANAVGMAIGESILAQRFNRPGHPVCDHHTYVFVGDGCLMEGISHEACSLAGTLGLGKLIVFWDDNGISIDGDVRGWFTDDTPQRFRAYGWQVIDAVDGHDPSAVAEAIELAKGDHDRPTLIDCKTVIGYGSPKKQGTAAAHGSPLGEDEIQAVREKLGWEYAPFDMPPSVYQTFDAVERGTALQSAWQATFAAYREAFPQPGAELQRLIDGRLSDGFEAAAAEIVSQIQRQGSSGATRKLSQDALETFFPLVPEFVGGSADLTGSNNTLLKSFDVYQKDRNDAQYIYYGVREFAMAAIINGLGLHGGLVPYGGTFLMFSEYARNALRMAALMELGSIFVFTHDSIGLGEDGPTHQAVEQAASLRLIPNMSVWRPCDGVETAAAWRAAIADRRRPTSILLTRQGVAHQPRDDAQVAAIERGGYVLIDPADGSAPDAIVIATGSEVGIASEAVTTLNEQGFLVRLVSMPSTDVFDGQDQAYRQQVLPPAVTRRLAVEAGVTAGWWKYVGTDGRVIGIDRFGESAPAEQLFEYLGLTRQAIVATLKELMQQT